MSSFGPSCRALRPGKAMSPWTSTATPMQTLFLERPHIVLPSALRRRPSGSSGHYVSSSHILSKREWRRPGRARSRRRASPSTTQGSQRSAGGRGLMNRILRCVLTLAHTVIEYVRIEGDRVVIRVRPALPDLQQEMRLLRQIARPSARRGGDGPGSVDVLIWNTRCAG